MTENKRPTFFVVKRIDLSKTLKQLRLNIANKKFREKLPCEVTIIDNIVSLNVPGATFGLKALTSGSAKASFGLEVFIQIVNSYKGKEIKVEIKDGLVIINTFSFAAKTTLFEDDTVLRSVVLPINYSDLDLISISASKLYTIEELKFNKLWILVDQAERRLKNNLSAAVRSLAPYGISRLELEELLDKKIKNRIDSTTNSFNIQKKFQDNASVTI